MITTDKAQKSGRKDDRQSTTFPRPQRRGKVALLVVLALIALGLGIRDLRHVGWYEEWRLSRMSLSALQQERAGKLDNPRLLYYIGLQLNKKGRFAEADPYLRNAVGLDPDTPRLRDAWATALVGSGQITAAFGELRQFAGTHSVSAPAHLLLGRFYMSQDSMVRASEELTQAITRDPSLAEGWSSLAAAQSGLGHFTEAAKAAEHAVALRPKSVTDRLGLALLLLGSGQNDRARHTFAEAVALNPKLPAAHLEYARCLLQVHRGPADLSLAEKEARRALALAPGNLIATLALGKILVAEGQAADAIPLLQQTAERSPYEPDAALALAQAYQRLNLKAQETTWEKNYAARNRRALLKQSLVTAIQKSPHDPEPQSAMARLLAEEGDVNGCIRHTAEALHSAPDAPPVLAAAANHLTAGGHPTDALPLAERAMAEAHNNPLAREAMGAVMLALGQPQSAAGFFSQAGRGLPHRNALYHKWLREYASEHAVATAGHAPKP